MAQKLSDTEIIAIVEQEFESSMGAPGQEISKERALAWNYYLSKPLGNEVDGRSKVVTSDVSDVVDSVMPSLLRMFTVEENLVSFEPEGIEDAELAQQESDYVNYIFFKRQPNAFVTMYTWFFDALVQKNGIVKCWWDESEVVTEETYKGLTEDEVIQLLNDDELEPVERDERRESFEVDGVPVETIVQDVTFKRTSTKGRIRVENVPPEEFRISGDSRCVDPNEARMVGQERDLPRSDLIAMGIDKDLVMSLPSVSDSYESEEEIARRDKTDEDVEPILKAANELVRVKEAYIQLDMTGNGKVERRQITTSGNHILINEACDRQPFHVVSPQPLPHKFFGRALAEKVMDIQKTNTTLLRQIMDNYYHTNNPGHAVWEQGVGEDTLDDLLTTEIGRIVRFDQPVDQSYSPMTVPFVAGHAFQGIEYFDKVKRDRTGVQADSDGLNPEQLKNIQQSVLTQANDLSRMKIETIARIFAETGIKSLFLHIHELVVKFQDREDVINLRGNWIPVNPTEWRDRHNMSVNIGLGIGSRETNLLHLNAIKEIQKTMVDMGHGNLTVTPKNFYNVATEIARNANLKNPNLYFADPGDQMAPPPAPEQMQLQQQAQLLQEKENALERRERQQDKAELQHYREMLKIEQNQDQHDDDVMIELEKLRNELTELRLKYGGAANG